MQINGQKCANIKYNVPCYFLLNAVVVHSRFNPAQLFPRSLEQGRSAFIESHIFIFRALSSAVPNRLIHTRGNASSHPLNIFLFTPP